MPCPLGAWEEPLVCKNIPRYLPCAWYRAGRWRAVQTAVAGCPVPPSHSCPGPEPSLPTLSSSCPSKQGLASLTCFAF